MQRIEVWKSGKSWYWHFRAKNGRIVSTGGEGFVSKANAIRAAKRVVTVVLGSPAIFRQTVARDGKITLITWG